MISTDCDSLSISTISFQQNLSEVVPDARLPSEVVPDAGVPSEVGSDFRVLSEVVSDSGLSVLSEVTEKQSKLHLLYNFNLCSKFSDHIDWQSSELFFIVHHLMCLKLFKPMLTC